MSNLTTYRRVQRTMLKLAAQVFSTMMLFTSAQANAVDDVEALVQTGDFNAALVKADQFLFEYPRDIQMRFLKGVIYTESGKTTDAIAIFAALTTDYPNLAEPHNNLAVLYAGQSQFEKARTSLATAIRINPSYVVAQENLGDVYAKMAGEAYSKALQLDSNSSGIKSKISSIDSVFKPELRTEGKNRPPELPIRTPIGALADIGKPQPSTIMPQGKVNALLPTLLEQPGSDAKKDVESAVRDWASAWSSKDMDNYIGSYSKDFVTPTGQGRKQWENERKRLILGKKSAIAITLQDLTSSLDGTKAIVTFKQIYNSGSLNLVNRKMLTMTKTGGRWLIARESTD